MKGLVLGVLRGTSILFLLAGPALAADAPKAQPPAELIPRARPSTTSFYGWQILATGGVGSVLATAAVLLPEQPLETVPSTVAFITGMPVFALGGPAVHWTHGDFGKGIISFGGNLALPLIGGFTGRAIRCGEDNAPVDCASRGFLTGLTVTAMITSVVDALVLGWEDVPLDDSQARGGPRFSRANEVRIVPWSSAGRDGLFQAGLAGRF